MVSIVIVSHSVRLAYGVRELVQQVTHGKVRVIAAGAVDGATLGTNPEAVRRALDVADTGDGVLVLVDLGSAIITTEMVLDELPPERRARVVLCEAPLVEGAVAAGALIAAGASLAEAAAEARAALTPKFVQLGARAELTYRHHDPPHWDAQAIVTVVNPLGLHAGPASLFVRTAARYQASVWVRNLTRGTTAVSARSINALEEIDARMGHVIAIGAAGPEAQAAVNMLKSLVESGFALHEPAEGIRLKIDGVRARARWRGGRTGPTSKWMPKKLPDHDQDDVASSPGPPVPDASEQINGVGARAVRDAVVYVEKHYASPISSSGVARAVFLNEHYFCRVFKAHTGLTFMSYLSRIRMEKAKQLLRETDLSVSDIARQVGYNDPNYFSRVFRRTEGVSPLVYRRITRASDTQPSQSDRLTVSPLA